MSVIVALVVLLVAAQPTMGAGSSVQEALAKVFGPWTSYGNPRTVQLLNQLCSESQKSDTIAKDACYGCFFRSSNLPAGFPMLLAMASCAEIYLNNTDYGHCSEYLRNATNSISSTTRTNPSIVYCSFVECIRQVNKEMLIRQCIREARSMFTTFNCTDIQLSQLFVNATACVLARTRCSILNPVTGAVQDDALANKFHVTSTNALQVNSDYDLNIIQVPFVQSAKNDECGKYRNLDSASWPSAEC